MAQQDTRQQQAALRQNQAAKAVRERFPEGTRVVARTGGMGGTVTRHVPALTSQGGHLVVEWDNGQTGRVQPVEVLVVFDIDQIQAFEGHVVTISTRDASLTGVVQDVGAWKWHDSFWIATGPGEGELLLPREVISLVDHGVDVICPACERGEHQQCDGSAWGHSPTSSPTTRCNCSH